MPAPCYRRLIEIVSNDAFTVTAWLEDDFHRFGVRVGHDGEKLTAIGVTSPRAPFSTCPAAAVKLQPLREQRLVSRASDIGAFIDMRAQCTHMFDLAGLAIAAASAGRPHRRYEIMVTDRTPTPQSRRPNTGSCQAVLWRDGVEVLNWRIDGQAIRLGSGDRSLQRGFRAWTEGLTVDEAEACLVLRRGIGVAAGRAVNVDEMVFASDIGLPPVCHTYGPDQARVARRNVGTRRDFSAGFPSMLDHADNNVFEGVQ
jgi:hypothetical protein